MHHHVRVARGRLGLRHRALDAVGARSGPGPTPAPAARPASGRRSGRRRDGRRSSGRRCRTCAARRPRLRSPCSSSKTCAARRPAGGSAGPSGRRRRRRASRAGRSPPAPRPWLGAVVGPGDEPVERHRHVQDGLATCGLLPQGQSAALEAVEGVAGGRGCARRAAPRSGSRPGPSSSASPPSRGANVNSMRGLEARPVEPGLGRREQDPARPLDRLEHVPVVVELVGRRAERDRPDAADAQVAARVDDPARARRCRRTRAGPPGSVNASKTRSGGAAISRSKRRSRLTPSARSTKRSKRSSRPSQARR